MKKIGRERRHARIAGRVRGTSARPRMVVFRTKKHMYVQVIDDTAHKVIVSGSTLGKEFRAENIKSSDTDAARRIGKIVAARSLGKGIKHVCFDRAGYLYHGRVKAVSEGAREGGLNL